MPRTDIAAGSPTPVERNCTEIPNNRVAVGEALPVSPLQRQTSADSRNEDARDDRIVDRTERRAAHLCRVGRLSPATCRRGGRIGSRGCEITDDPAAVRVRRSSGARGECARARATELARSCDCRTGPSRDTVRVPGCLDLARRIRGHPRFPIVRAPGGRTSSLQRVSAGTRSISTSCRMRRLNTRAPEC